MKAPEIRTLNKNNRIRILNHLLLGGGGIPEQIVWDAWKAERLTGGLKRSRMQKLLGEYGYCYRNGCVFVRDGFSHYLPADKPEYSEVDKCINLFCRWASYARRTLVND